MSPNEPDPQPTAIPTSERVGRLVTWLWLAVAFSVFVAWLTRPELFTQEAMAARMASWGPWTFVGYIVVCLIRGLTLVPSTPVILAGGILFPNALVAVFFVCVIGIVISTSLLYLMPGFGGYDALLERKYPEKIAKVKQQLVKPRAFWFVAGWAFFPLVPTDVICYAAGLVQMPLQRMISALLVGKIPLILGYLFLTQQVLAILG